jgi:hypothetical protein
MLIFSNRREAFVCMKILLLMRRLDSLPSTGVRGLKIVGMKNVKIYCVPKNSPLDHSNQSFVKRLVRVSNRFQYASYGEKNVLLLILHFLRNVSLGVIF